MPNYTPKRPKLRHATPNSIQYSNYIKCTAPNYSNTLTKRTTQKYNCFTNHLQTTRAIPITLTKLPQPTTTIWNYINYLPPFHSLQFPAPFSRTKASTELEWLLTKSKGPREGERREPKYVSSVFSFLPSFPRKYTSRERHVWQRLAK